MRAGRGRAGARPRGGGGPGLEALPLVPQLRHLGAPRGELLARVEQRRERLVVEKGNERERSHPAPAPPHGQERAPGGGPTGGGELGRPGAGGGQGRQTTSTRIVLVEPGTLTAVPAVITTRSPDSTSPLRRAASRERAQRSATPGGPGVRSGTTP